MLFNQDPRKKAIAYYRHSAEDKQENSVPIQRGHAEKFAQQYNIDIIHEEADEGKTGLLADRPGFKNLFNNWILNEEAPHFDYILVYDVSRWGRFQDQDEAAHYEFECKQRKKKVIYIARGFPKEEQQLISHLQTSIERYMAAEYSCQLSDKVFYGCVKVSEQGFSAGGTACYGMTRLLLDENKKPIKALKKGEWKSLSNERITFTPAKDETAQVVKDIFRLLVDEWKTPKEIALKLNSENVLSPGGFSWDAQKVRHILTNETYTGARIYNKTWGRLKQKNRNNPRNEWVIKHNAFQGLITQERFRSAQERLYWLMPSKWKRGTYLTRKAEKLMKNEVENILLEKKTDLDTIEQVLKKYPLTLAVTAFNEGAHNWCFKISEADRNNSFVVGVGLSLEQDIRNAKFFVIPTDNFNSCNYFLLNDKEATKRKYSFKSTKLKEVLDRFTKEQLTTYQK
jgi:DNA invertase Pin-like site-specific DNA recombinase